MKKLILTILIIVLIYSPLYGDKIYLKNGRVLKGEIIKEEKELVELRIYEGIVSIRKEEISSLEYEKKGEEKPLATGIKEDTYTNLTYRCQISQPSKGWIMSDRTDDPQVLVIMKKRVSPKGSAPTVSLSVVNLKDLPKLPTVSEYAKKGEEVVSLFSGYKKIKEGMISWKDKEAFERIFTTVRESSKEEIKVKCRQVYILREGVAYIITSTDLEKTFPDNLNDFNTILESFKFL
jgi:hypothetical protein